jgi:Rrf2 family protein
VLKLTKKADYGLIAMRHLAVFSAGRACSAKDVAEAYGIPQEALAKILQRLARAKLLSSQHGANGGYALARDARSISAFEVIEAIDGPLLMTSCSVHKNDCEQSRRCTIREPLHKVSEKIQQVLMRMKIADMAPDWADEEPAPSVRERELVHLS